MTTLLTFANGTTRTVSDAAARNVRGLDEDGDLVIATDLPADAGGPYLIALTPCCDASGKGSESPTGIVCRACKRTVDSKFGGRAQVTAAVVPTVVVVDSIPFPVWETDQLAVGDVVTVSPDAVRGRAAAAVMYRISGVRGDDTYDADPCRGGRGTRGHRNTFLRVTDAARLARAAAETDAAVEVGPLHVGAMVKFARPRTSDQKGLFVIIKENSTATYNVAPLGGSDNGRFYRNVTTKDVVSVPREAVVVIDE